MRHVNGAGSDEKRFAPRAIECRDIRGESDDCSWNAVDRAQADGGDFDDLPQFGTACSGGACGINGTVWELAKGSAVPEPSSLVLGLISLALAGGAALLTHHHRSCQDRV